MCWQDCRLKSVSPTDPARPRELPQAASPPSLLPESCADSTDTNRSGQTPTPFCKLPVFTAQTVTRKGINPAKGLSIRFPPAVQSTTPFTNPFCPEQARTRCVQVLIMHLSPHGAERPQRAESGGGLVSRR